MMASTLITLKKHQTMSNTPENPNSNKRCAISSEDISTPVIRPSKAKAINSDVYINQCFPKLEEFIEKYHAGGDYMFWPDLASCHYSKKTTDWFTGQNILFVPKKDNPPNVPQTNREFLEQTYT